MREVIAFRETRMAETGAGNSAVSEMTKFINSDLRFYHRPR